MPTDRAAQNAPEQDQPVLSGVVRPLRTDEMGRTLAVRLTPTVDKLRQLLTGFGVRAYRVFMVHVQWSGEAIGRGNPNEIARREILPTPRVRELSSTAEVLSAFGRLEEGGIAIDKITASLAEDDLMGHTPDLVDPANPRAGKRNVEFFWEVMENRPVFPTPVPRRYVPGAAPTLSRGGMGWRVNLTKQSVDRSRQQQMIRRDE